MTTFQVNDNLNCRLDVFLAGNTTLTRSYIKKLADDGNVFLNGKAVKCNKSVKNGDVVEINIPEIQDSSLTPTDIPIDIVYQDDDIAVINKPQGLTVHAGNGTHGSTLVNALLYHLDN